MNQFDYIIVGGGTAGCVLANRLTATGRFRVLLVEAGDKPRNPWINIPAGFSKLLVNKNYNWRFSTEAEASTKQRVIAIPRGKGLGGSTLINGMIYVRGRPCDYDTWHSLGAQGWDYQTVAPYFHRVENYAESGSLRGREGPVHVERVRERFPIASAFIDAAKKSGLPYNEDYNGAQQFGVGFYQVTQHNGRRWSAYDAYLRPALARSNLSVATNAQVLRLDLDGKRCVGVTYRIGGHQVSARANAEVIVSAGAVQSPQVLELSGIGQPDLLASLGIPVCHALPGVGENYIDHYATRMNWRVKNTVTLNEMARGWRLAMAALQYGATRKGILTLGTGLVNAFVKTEPQLPEADCQYFFVHASYANAAERILDRKPGMTLGVSQLRPESMGSIHIKSTDPNCQPSIRPNFLSAVSDQECLVRGMRLAREIVGNAAMQHYIDHELSPGLNTSNDEEWLDFARENGQSIYHPIGTCRMGQDDRAVVDPRLRVLGLQSLRVVDASVMPAMISGNIQAAVMMVAERASDLILEDARS
ncbi:MAG: choline dehydrogenase [Achromobacter sp.]|nr:choline dehydrogenase [Achromobacter sp.]